MIVFNAFWKILKKYKWTIILYTGLLIIFGGLNLETSEKEMNFASEKPDISIIINDENKGITKNLVSYLEKNCKIKEIKEEKLNDALFYRDVNYIIYIPKDYRKKFLNKENPIIEIKSTKDYNASLANLILERYLKVADFYLQYDYDEKSLIENINTTLDKKVNIDVAGAKNALESSRITSYFNFASYSLLAGGVYVVCLILSSFKEEKIRRRTIVSKMNYKTINNYLLLANALFMVGLWIIYIILGALLLGSNLFSSYGLIYIINSFVFTICTLSIAFLIGNVIQNKDAISGIINVVALGSSFLCGAFVPMEWLPPFVLKIAHILPSYWYIKTNEILKTLETINYNSLKPILFNMIVIIGFSIFFYILANYFSKKKLSQ